MACAQNAISNLGRLHPIKQQSSGQSCRNWRASIYGFVSGLDIPLWHLAFWKRTNFTKNGPSETEAFDLEHTTIIIIIIIIIKASSKHHLRVALLALRTPWGTALFYGLLHVHMSILEVEGHVGHLSRMGRTHPVNHAAFPAAYTF